MELHCETVEGLATEKFGAVLNNPLLVRNICFFTHEADLIRLRLVNHLLYGEATRQLRLVHERKPVNLKEESRIDTFIGLIRNRMDSETEKSFPFSAFTLDLRNSEESFERLAAEIGQHIRRLKFHTLPELDQSSYHLEQKMTLLLRHTLNLTVIELKTHSPVYLANRDLPTLPSSFPHLKVIKVEQNTNHEGPSPPDSVPLLTFLVNRAPGLHVVDQLCIGNSFESSQGLEVLSGLAQFQRNHLPSFRKCSIEVRPQTLHILQELNKYHPLLRKLESLTLQNARNTEPWSPSFVRIVSDLLSTASSSLKDLRFDLSGSLLEENAIFPMPVFQALTNIEFWVYPNREVAPQREFVVHLTVNSFPALRDLTLSLSFAQNNLVSFWGTSLPSVMKFRVVCFSSTSILGSNSWHRILTNLSTIEFFVTRSSIPFDEQNLAYILKHFPYLTNLLLYFGRVTNDEQDCDFWETLTGGAVRPVSREVLLHGVLNKQGDDMALVGPIEGIYEVPSLGNLSALRTLELFPRMRSNLDAILYMTRAGLLVPLKYLAIGRIADDLEMGVEEIMTYRDIFAQVHIEVNIS